MKYLIVIFIIWLRPEHLNALEGGHGGGPREENLTILSRSFFDDSTLDVTTEEKIPRDLRRQIEDRTSNDQRPPALVTIYLLMIKKNAEDPR